jgi:uncharacterized membrane protein
VVAVRKQPPQAERERERKRTTYRKRLKAQIPERKERCYTVRLFGTNSL